MTPLRDTRLNTGCTFLKDWSVGRKKLGYHYYQITPHSVLVLFENHNSKEYSFFRIACIFLNFSTFKWNPISAVILSTNTPKKELLTYRYSLCKCSSIISSNDIWIWETSDVTTESFFHPTHQRDPIFEK